MASFTLTNLANYAFGIGADETAINVDKVTVKASGKVKEVPSRISQIVGRVDYQFMKKISVSGFVSGTTGVFSAANIGNFVTVANDVALAGLATTLGLFLDDIEITRTAEDLEKVVYNLSAYPGIASSATQTTT
jgi:hypothetical protein